MYSRKGFNFFTLYTTCQKKESNFPSTIHACIYLVNYSRKITEQGLFYYVGFPLRKLAIHGTKSEGNGLFIFFLYRIAVMHLGCRPPTFNLSLPITAILFVTTLLLGGIYTPLGISIYLNVTCIMLVDFVSLSISH